jgi:hypothetical protein
MATAEELKRRQLKARQSGAASPAETSVKAAPDDRVRAFWQDKGLGGLYDFIAGESNRAVKSSEDQLRSVASGMTFGLADEAAAGAAALTGVGRQEGAGDDYSSNLAAERARDEQIPTGTRIAGEVAGGIATGSGLARAGGAVLGVVAPKAGQALARLPGYVKAVGTGGAVGGAYGAGTAEGGAGNRLAGAATGAALGAGTAGLAYPLVKAGEAGIRAIGRGLENRMGPATAGQGKVLQAMERDQMTPAKVRARLRALGPQATLADAGGENLTGLARAAAGVPGPAKNRAAIVLNQRAEGEAARLTQKINKNLKPKDFFAAEDEFLGNLRSNAAEIYQEAYQAGKQLESKTLTRLLERPIARDAMKEAAELAGIEGRRLSALDPTLTAQAKEAVKLGLLDPGVVPKGGIGRGITTEAIDDLKKGLDSIIDRETNQFTGGLTKRGALIAGFKRDLLREVDSLNPLYAKARATYAGDAEVLNALRLGRDFMKLDPEEITRAMAGMSIGAQQAYRSGAARAMKDIIDNTPDMASASRRLFGKSVTRQRLQAMFPDQETYNDLARALLSESRFSQVRNTVLGGSPTAARLAEQSDLGVDPGIVQGALQGRGGLISGLVRAGMDKLTQPNPVMANELSKMLFSRNQPMNQLALDQLLARAQLGGVNKRNVNALGQALLQGTAQQEGRFAGDIYSQRP